MILLIDNYDSFTYNLTDYFARLGEETTVIRNDEADAETVAAYRFDRLVISPGPNTPSESGNLMQMIGALHDRVPVLGICLGHQALGQFFGARLVHAQRPMHGKISALRHDGQGIYTGLPPGFSVCRYHSLILDGLENTPLRITSRTDEGECMSFEHDRLPVTGIQYHPEAILTEFGLDILANWLSLTGRPISSPE